MKFKDYIKENEDEGKQQKCPKCGSYDIEFQYMNSRVPRPKEKGKTLYQCMSCSKKFKK